MNGTQELKVAVAQFTVRREPEWNLDIIDGYAWQAADAGARLLVLPEGLIARDGDDDLFTGSRLFCIGRTRATTRRAVRHRPETDQRRASYYADGHGSCCARRG